MQFNTRQVTVAPYRRCVSKSSPFISTGWPTQTSQPAICTDYWACWCLWLHWYNGGLPQHGARRPGAGLTGSQFLSGYCQRCLVGRDFLPHLTSPGGSLDVRQRSDCGLHKERGRHTIVHTNADDDTPAQVVRSQGDHVGSRPSARSPQHPGRFPVQSRGDSEHGVDDGHGASATHVGPVGRAAGQLVCNFRQQTTRQVCIAIGRPQGQVDGCHVSSLGQREGPTVCLPTIQDAPSSTAGENIWTPGPSSWTPCRCPGTMGGASCLLSRHSRWSLKYCRRSLSHQESRWFWSLYCNRQLYGFQSWCIQSRSSLRVKHCWVKMFW